MRVALWLTAVVAALALYFLPTLETPLYWIPLVAGAMAAYAVSRIAIRVAMARYEVPEER